MTLLTWIDNRTHTWSLYHPQVGLLTGYKWHREIEEDMFGILGPFDYDILEAMG